MDINKKPGYVKTGTASSGGKEYAVWGPPKTREKPTEKAQPMPEQTPKGILDRQKWERFQFKKHGNPFVPRKQIYGEIDRITKENEETLFAHVFGNQYRFEDRGSLDPQAQGVYRSALLKFRKNVSDSIMADVEQKQAQHKERMALWDKYYGKDKPEEVKLMKGKGGTMIPKVEDAEFWTGGEDKGGITNIDRKRVFDALSSYEKKPTDEKFMILKDMAADLGYVLGEEEKEETGKFTEWLARVLGWKPQEEKISSRKESETIDEYLKRVGG